MANFPRFELPELDFSKIQWPEFELPKFELPNADLPEIELPSVEQIAGFARDAAYVGIGLVVMTAERLQALQQQLVEAFTTQLDKVREAA
jgi:hypothetical protein